MQVAETGCGCDAWWDGNCLRGIGMLSKACGGGMRQNAAIYVTGCVVSRL